MPVLAWERAADNNSTEYEYGPSGVLLSSVVYCIDLILWFDTLPIVPLHTEALAATSDSEVERIIPELRSALREHTRLAKESLKAQVGALERPLPEMP